MLDFRLFAAILLIPLASRPAEARPAAVIHRLSGADLSAADADAIASAELKAAGVTGAELAILNKGHVVWTYAFGLRDVARNLPMTFDTNLWAASITKAVFATWVVGQVSRGRLSLDEPVARMLPRPLNEYEPYRDTAADLANDPQWLRVTPRMLLSHTSGLANFAALEPDRRLHLHFRPGDRFAYSGDGLNILQFALEHRLGLKLDEAMRRDIFDPLGMTRTGMVWRPEFDENSALRYDARGTLIGATHRAPARAAGSMETTVNDLVRFLEALLANRIPGASMNGPMFTTQIQIHSAHEFPTLDPSTGNDGEKSGLSYGLGWGLLTKTRYGPAFFKEGHGDGAENYVICFRRNGTCMILLTNSDNGELAFRPLLEKLIGDDVTPWDWEGYTRESILANEEHAHR